MKTIYRAKIFHTPKSPFDGAELVFFEDGGLVVENGLIDTVGNFDSVSNKYPQAEIISYQNSFIIPGLVDSHVHYPQIPVIGAMGLRLLDWLDQKTLPAEAKFADKNYAREQAQIFLKQLARNGTTTALVFGAHFAQAMEEFFTEADKSGLRITAGLVLGDRMLKDELYTNPNKAYKESKALIEKWHNKNRLRYAVTPRFSVSCSDDILAVCGRLVDEYPSVFFTTHMNEQLEEIDLVKRQFSATDYLETYEKHGLVNKRSVFAHNVHPSNSELKRMSKAKASVAHCPSSNMFIGSGLFNMLEHIQHKINFALGSDVGGGTGFSILKEALMSYQAQMLRQKPYPLTAAHLLYLATLAGAKVLGLDDKIGDFSSGKEADFVVLEAAENSTLAQSLKHSKGQDSLAAIFTLAREDAIKDVFVAGESIL